MFAFGMGVVAFYTLAVIAAVGAWITHVVWIIQHLASSVGATAGQIVLGILGTVVPPIGVIHGFILWFT